MAVDDLWYLKKKDENGDRIRSQRYGRGKQYRVRWIDEKGEPCAQLFAKKKDAVIHDANVHADLSRGQYVDPKSGRLTFSKYAARWQDNQVHRGTTRAQVETHMRRHVLPYFGDRHLASIRPTDVQAWVRKLSDTLSPATVEVVYRYGSAVFTAAVADRLITATPCVNVKLPRINRKRIEPLPVALVNHLYEEMCPLYRALILVGAAAGLRQGEAFGLEVDRVDFLRRTLRVDQQLSLLPGAPPFLAPPKTPSSYRTLPIGRHLVEALAAHLAAFPAREVEVIDNTGPRPVTRMAQLIFSTDAGHPIDRPRFGRAIRPAVVAARAALVTAATDPASEADAVATATRFAGATFHDLRHFYASLLISEGANVKEVQARLGHANAAETLNIYSHLWPDSDERTREAVDRVFGVAQVRPGLTQAV